MAKVESVTPGLVVEKISDGADTDAPDKWMLSARVDAPYSAEVMIEIGKDRAEGVSMVMIYGPGDLKDGIHKKHEYASWSPENGWHIEPKGFTANVKDISRGITAFVKDNYGISGPPPPGVERARLGVVSDNYRQALTERFQGNEKARPAENDRDPDPGRSR